MKKSQNLLNEGVLKELISSGELRNEEGVEEVTKMLTGQIVNSILNGEIDAFLGYEKYDRKMKTTANSRNGSSQKKVKTNVGEMCLKIPRDRNNEYSPLLVKKGERELSFFKDRVLALYAKGMSTRDIVELISELYNYKISPETVSRITERVQADRDEWHNRPLEPLYAVVYLDGFNAKVRVENSVRNVCVYVAIGIKVDGSKDCLGFWVDSQSESAKYWLSVLNGLLNRGLKEVLIFCVDNLSGISEAISACFPEAEIQKCVVHQVRNSLKYVSYKNLQEVVNDLKGIYKAPTESDGIKALEKFEEKWGGQYAYIGKSWRHNWDELSVYFKYSPEIRRLIYTNNPIEAVNRGIRRRVKTRNVFPSLEALGKVVYLALDEISQKWVRKPAEWGKIYSQLRIYYGERLAPYERE